MNRTQTIAISELLVIVFLIGFSSYFYVTASASWSKSSQSSFSEPPPLSRPINNTEDLMSDLTSLGCHILYITDRSPYALANIPMNYTEFRRMAYNCGVVLCYYSPYSASEMSYVLWAIFDGVGIRTDLIL